MTDSDDSEQCGHYDEQFAVRQVVFDDDEEGKEIEETCSWCDADQVAGAFVKSERHVLALCQDCADVLEILVQSGETTNQEGSEHDVNE